jgi:hypothetical protein
VALRLIIAVAATFTRAVCKEVHERLRVQVRGSCSEVDKSTTPASFARTHTVVISDLHANVATGSGSGDFFTREANVLERHLQADLHCEGVCFCLRWGMRGRRNLTKRGEPSVGSAAHVQSLVVEVLCDLQRVVRIPVPLEQNRSRLFSERIRTSVTGARRMRRCVGTEMSWWSTPSRSMSSMRCCTSQQADFTTVWTIQCRSRSPARPYLVGTPRCLA